MREGCNEGKEIVLKGNEDFKGRPKCGATRLKGEGNEDFKGATPLPRPSVEPPPGPLPYGRAAPPLAFARIMHLFYKYRRAYFPID